MCNIHNKLLGILRDRNISLKKQKGEILYRFIGNISTYTLYNNDIKNKVFNTFKKIYDRMNYFTRELGK